MWIEYLEETKVSKTAQKITHCLSTDRPLNKEGKMGIYCQLTDYQSIAFGAGAIGKGKRQHVERQQEKGRQKEGCIYMLEKRMGMEREKKRG